MRFPPLAPSASSEGWSVIVTVPELVYTSGLQSVLVPEIEKVPERIDEEVCAKLTETNRKQRNQLHFIYRNYLNPQIPESVAGRNRGKLTDAALRRTSIVTRATIELGDFFGSVALRACSTHGLRVRAVRSSR